MGNNSAVRSSKGCPIIDVLMILNVLEKTGPVVRV